MAKKSKEPKKATAIEIAEVVIKAVVAISALITAINQLMSQWK